jgi:hypothetical protein
MFNFQGKRIFLHGDLILLNPKKKFLLQEKSLLESYYYHQINQQIIIWKNSTFEIVESTAANRDFS